MIQQKSLFAALGASLALACAPPSVSLKCPESAGATAPPPPAAVVHTTANVDHGNRYEERHVYRLDFVLTATDGTAPQTTSFSITLGEHDKGDIHLGKNVMLSQTQATATTPALGGPRQDVGVKVVASVGSLFGEDLMLDVSTEVSAFDPPTTIRKISAIGKALATPGKSTVVAMLEEDKKRYQLSVTPTKLR